MIKVKVYFLFLSFSSKNTFCTKKIVLLKKPCVFLFIFFYEACVIIKKKSLCDDKTKKNRIHFKYNDHKRKSIPEG